MTTRKIEQGKTIVDELANYTAPQEIYIGSGKESANLYKLEERRNDVINSCAKEWGKLRGLDPDDRDAYWTTIMPQALFDVLEGFTAATSVIAAEAFLKQFGWKVERPGARPQDDHVGDVVHEAISSLADEIENLYHRAGSENDLSVSVPAYSAKAPEGQRWSYPYDPIEIAAHVRSKIDEVTANIKAMARG